VADLVTIRTRLAANLATVPGLRTSAEIIDNPSPPVALVNLEGVEYDGAMKGGLTTYNFTIVLVVGRAAERTMQRKLDGYLQPTGQQSVKSAVESDRTLAGEVYDLRVESAQSVGSITINDQTYLAAEFTVTVFA
jgi:hypothetical protein